MREECLYKDICENECEQSCIRFLEMNFLLEHSGIPKNKRKIHKLVPEQSDRSAFEDLADIRDDIVSFVNNGECLYIYSENCGNGKTTWTIKMLLQYFNDIWAGNGFRQRGMFINVPYYLTMSKDFNNKIAMDYIESIRNAIIGLDLVIFDDIASTRLSDYDNANLLTAIDSRMLEEKAMIFTGNIIPDKLSDYVGKRLASRICSGTIVNIKGKDRRIEW